MYLQIKLKTIIFLLFMFTMFAIPGGYLQDMDSSDLTEGLSDEDIKLTLKDLPLSDLNALSRLIDSEYKKDNNLDDNSFLNSNLKDQYNFNANFGKDIDFKGFGSVGAKMPEVNSFDYEDQNSQYNFDEEMPRYKREKDHLDFDVEYMKQLQDSFPRDTEQTSHDGFDLENEHVRIKRYINSRKYSV